MAKRRAVNCAGIPPSELLMPADVHYASSFIVNGARIDLEALAARLPVR